MEILSAVPKLAVHKLNKEFDGKPVLKELDFTIQEGEFLSILGDSGSGKTTLLKILIGIEEPSSGEIRKDGNKIDQLQPHERGIGMVFQNYALFPHMSAMENIMYPLIANKKKEKEAKRIVLDLLDKMGMLEHKDKPPSQLSGGQKQRVAIARTLALEPDILLFDEALAALDASNRMKLSAEFKEIQKTFQVTIVYVTHDQEEALGISDRVLILNQGKIEQLDTPFNICKKPKSRYIEEFVNVNLHKRFNSMKQLVGDLYEKK
ncbi:ABC transporter ATP-binding protein [Paenibacillus dendritiformis]|uniref:ABC transporter ATP-binding protein n=1 Tax=Paenibacillus dendritiformis TaxID=130049 RepID=UPI000DA87919|nr:ABC transporter ATP-binding protein [Paenibacillus dendritiformis]PZM67276.1 ABC transporter ATP-binding protein [Paenibacillus dendritiformis]